MSSWFDELVKGNLPTFVFKLGKRLLFGPSPDSGECRRCNALLWQCPYCHMVGCLEKGCTRSLTAGTGFCACGKTIHHDFKALPGGRCTGIRM